MRASRPLTRLRRRLDELDRLLDALEQDVDLIRDVASWPERTGVPLRIGSGVSDPTGTLATSARHMRLRRALDGVERTLRISARELAWRLDCLDAALQGDPTPPRRRRG